MLFLWILVDIFVAVTVWLVFWAMVTFLVGKSRKQVKFLTGTVPTEAPSGFYRG